MASIRLFLCVEGKHRVRKIYLARRPAIAEAADRLMDLVELDGDLHVVSFKLENGLLDCKIFGTIHEAYRAGDERLQGEEKE